MKTQTAVIYASEKELTPLHRFLRPTIRDGDRTMPGMGPGIFVRLELTDLDIQDALEKATPMAGEIVLNSFELSGL